MSQQTHITPSLSRQPRLDARRTETLDQRVAIAAASVVVADAADVARLRLDPGPAPAGNLTMLKHSECQTIISLAAALRAVEANPDLGSFDDWGVIVAPCRPGRSETAHYIERFHAIGVRGIGPHSIPTLSLHASAATLSMFLGAHGPVFGVSGGPAHVADGLLAGLTAQLGRSTMGTWLVLTNWVGDDSTGRGVAIALALGPFVQGSRQRCLGYRASSPTASRASAQLEILAEYVVQPSGLRWDCPLEGGGELTLFQEV